MTDVAQRLKPELAQLPADDRAALAHFLRACCKIN